MGHVVTTSMCHWIFDLSLPTSTLINRLKKHFWNCFADNFDDADPLATPAVKLMLQYPHVSKFSKFIVASGYVIPDQYW